MLYTLDKLKHSAYGAGFCEAAQSFLRITHS